MTHTRFARVSPLLAGAIAVAAAACALGASPQPRDGYEVNDTHFHLTNYIQEGTNIRDFLQIIDRKSVV